jgi:tRNA modification GTPase
VPATLIDTAGLRDTDDPIEAEGVRRARARAGAADLVLHVTDGLGEPALGQRIVNKIDIGGQAPGEHDEALFVSAKTGAGLRELETWLIDWARRTVHAGELPLVARERQRTALNEAVSALDQAIGEADTVLRAEALRLAARALGRVTGRVDVEEVLGAIFGRFCIGK